MQNKSAIWIFTILLAIACVYQLSFSFVTSGVENDALAEAQRKVDSVLTANTDTLETELAQDQALQDFQQNVLQGWDSKEVYPLIGFTYGYCKKNEINLGLDLQGGMNVTLQVSVKDMIKALSGGNSDEAFLAALNRASEMQKNAQDDYVTLFEQAWNEAGGGSLAAVFHNRENKEKFPLEATNEEVMQIIRDEAESAIGRAEQVLRKRIDNLGVVQPSIQRQAGTGRIIVELPGVKDQRRVRRILQGTAKLEFWKTYDNAEIYTKLEQANEVLAEKLGLREDTKEAKPEPDTTVADSGDDIIVESETQSPDTDSAAADDPYSIENLLSDDGAGNDSVDSLNLNQSQAEQRRQNPLFSLLQPNIYPGEDGKYYIGKGATAGYSSKKDTAEVNEILERREIKAIFGRRVKFLWAAKPYDDKGQYLQLFAIEVDSKDGIAPLEGDAVTNARVTSDPLGNPEVSLSMNSDGAKTWKNMTSEAAGNPEDENDNKSIAIVLDDRVYSAPGVSKEIAGGQSSISGSFSVEEAEDLANVLKAGKLPAPARIIEEAIVGPELGEEAIQAGFLSFLLALVVVLLYMAFYYSSAGIVADLALLSNLFFIMGVLSSLGATLTLPGIAGIVLTIGMSVDANVLIYERIREELRAGKGVRLAIVDGYKNAYSSIIDANITTLLTGIILYVFGSGPIKGFATTLIIGIATSLFAAIFLTRLLFEWRLDRNSMPSFASKLTENVMTNVNWQFVKKRKMFYIISGVIILIGVGSLATRQLNFGVDFTGGRSYVVRFDESHPVSDVAQALGDVFVNEDGQRSVPQVKTYGSSNQVKITTKYLIDNNDTETDDLVEEKLYQGLSEFVNGASQEQFSEDYLMSSQKVGPTIADDIKQGAVWSVLFSLIVIFLYILIRFRKWQFGLGALAAMFHDVLIVLSLFSLLYGIMPFSLEIDQAFIAAILTVVGYSINDTVVVFDRIREYLGLHKRREQKTVINDALNSTLSRTINTSLSTLVVLLMIFIFGGEVIRGFVFALIIGIIVGTYSSLCIATPVVVDLAKDKSKKD